MTTFYYQKAISRQISVAVFYTAFFCLLTFAISADAADFAKVKIDGAAKTAAVAIIDHNGIAGVSLTDMCVALGWTWKWDFASQKLVCNKGKRHAAFTVESPFYTAGDSLLQMPVAPYRDGGMIYCEAPLCADAFSHITQQQIVWNKDDSTLTVSEAPVVDKAEKPAVDSVPVVTQNDAQNSAKNDVDEVAEPKKAEPKKNPAKNRSQQEVIKTVVIDPGHGGIDPGAIGPDGHQEKEIVLDVALQLRDIMKKQSDITVYLTRDHDIFIPLQDRTRFANRKKADLFVSIHANSIDGDERKKESAKGFKVYFLSQAKNEDDKMVAMRENAVIKLEDKTNRYDNLQNILIDMVGNEYLRESQDFSIMIAESFHTKLKQIPKLNLGVGQANFWVLNGAYMPSVLIEVGFISNKKEEDHLKDAATQQTIAQGIFEAIMNLRSKFESE